MIETIIITLGLLGCIDALFHKWHTWDAIRSVLEKAGEKLNKRIIFRLGQCLFCQRFWLTVKIVLTVGYFSEYTKELVLVPFVVIGLFNIIHQQ